MNQKNVHKKYEWVLQPQKAPGTCTFDGNGHVTTKVFCQIPPWKLKEIMEQLHDLVKAENGAHFQQTFKNAKTGEMVFIFGDTFLKNETKSGKVHYSLFHETKNSVAFIFEDEYKCL